MNALTLGKVSVRHQRPWNTPKWRILTWCVFLPERCRRRDLTQFCNRKLNRGGEGRVRGAEVRVHGAAHLTLPVAAAPGPLPLPPEGLRGAPARPIAPRM